MEKEIEQTDFNGSLVKTTSLEKAKLIVEDTNNDAFAASKPGFSFIDCLHSGFPDSSLTHQCLLIAL